MVVAKVTCTSLGTASPTAPADNVVTFTTVYEPDASKDPQNARFTKATPNGTIQMAIDNPAAIAQFEVGKNYFVVFSPAP